MRFYKIKSQIVGAFCLIYKFPYVSFIFGKFICVKDVIKLIFWVSKHQDPSLLPLVSLKSIIRYKHLVCISQI